METVADRSAEAEGDWWSSQLAQFDSCLAGERHESEAEADGDASVPEVHLPTVARSPSASVCVTPPAFLGWSVSPRNSTTAAQPASPRGDVASPTQSSSTIGASVSFSTRSAESRHAHPLPASQPQLAATASTQQQAKPSNNQQLTTQMPRVWKEYVRLLRGKDLNRLQSVGVVTSLTQSIDQYRSKPKQRFNTGSSAVRVGVHAPAASMNLIATPSVPMCHRSIPMLLLFASVAVLVMACCLIAAFMTIILLLQSEIDGFYKTKGDSSALYAHQNVLLHYNRIARAGVAATWSADDSSATMSGWFRRVVPLVSNWALSDTVSIYLVDLQAGVGVGVVPTFDNWGPLLSPGLNDMPVTDTSVIGVMLNTSHPTSSFSLVDAASGTLHPNTTSFTNPVEVSTNWTQRLFLPAVVNATHLNPSASGVGALWSQPYITPDGCACMSFVSLSHTPRYHVTVSDYSSDLVTRLSIEQLTSGMSILVVHRSTMTFLGGNINNPTTSSSGGLVHLQEVADTTVSPILRMLVPQLSVCDDSCSWTYDPESGSLLAHPDTVWALSSLRDNVLVRSTSVRDSFGLDLIVLVLIPSLSITTRLWNALVRSIIIAAACCGGLLLVVTAFSWWLLAPLRLAATHMVTLFHFAMRRSTPSHEVDRLLSELQRFVTSSESPTANECEVTSTATSTTPVVEMKTSTTTVNGGAQPRKSCAGEKQTSSTRLQHAHSASYYHTRHLLRARRSSAVLDGIVAVASAVADLWIGFVEGLRQQRLNFVEVSALYHAMLRMYSEIHVIRSFLPSGAAKGRRGVVMSRSGQMIREAWMGGETHRLAAPDDANPTCRVVPGGEYGDTSINPYTTTSDDDENDSPAAAAGRECRMSEKPPEASSKSRRDDTREAAGQGVPFHPLTVAATMQATRREVTSLVINLIGFHAAASALPSLLSDMLGSCLHVVQKAAQRRRGTVASFHGDRIYAHFNAETNVRRHASAAIRTMLEVELELEKLRAKMAQTNPQQSSLRIRGARMGVATSEALCGVLGVQDRIQNFHVVGRCVPLSFLLSDRSCPTGVFLEAAQRRCQLLCAPETVQHAGIMPGVFIRHAWLILSVEGSPQSMLLSEPMTRSHLMRLAHGLHRSQRPSAAREALVASNAAFLLAMEENFEQAVAILHEFGWTERELWLLTLLRKLAPSGREVGSLRK